MFTFTLKVNSITPGLAAAAKKVQRPRTLFEAGAKTVQRGIVKHLKTLQTRGNKMGWPSRGFFAGARDSVEKNVGIASITDNGAVVTIADPRFIHRITGGDVTPKRRQYLAIPLRAEAYALQGKGSLRESAPFLTVIRARTGRLYLAKVMPGHIELWFLLTKKVTHKPHPEEMPPVEELTREAGDAMLKAANLLLSLRGS